MSPPAGYEGRSGPDADRVDPGVELALLDQDGVPYSLRRVEIMQNGSRYSGGLRGPGAKPRGSKAGDTA